MVVSLPCFHRCSVVLANERIRSRAELPLYLKEGELWTDLYCKPTDKHLYLHHPSATKKAIPYGLGIRLKRICSKEDDYQKNRKELKHQLMKRWYSGRFTEEQLKRVYSKKREDLLKYRQKSTEKNERAPLVLTFSNLLPVVTSTVQKHLKLLHQSNRMQEAFKEPPMDAFRRGGGKLRGYSSAYEADQDPGHHTQSCRLRNVVYCLTCKVCDKPVYVGETERQLRERIDEHRAFS